MTRKPKAVREPIQVYLTEHERSLLDQVAGTVNLSRAEVLRQGLRRFSAEALGASHPVLVFLDEMSTGWPATTPSDAGKHHDHYLTESYAPAARPARKSARR